MAYNPIQFQHGISLPEFLQCFGTEAACAEAPPCQYDLMHLPLRIQ